RQAGKVMEDIARGCHAFAASQRLDDARGLWPAAKACHPPGGLAERTLSLLKSDLGCLFVLLLLATAIRVWLICHTEVTSRDSIGYERFAWELAHDDWKHVLSTNVHHPLYPLTVLAVSGPVRQIVNSSDLVVMQLSAQIASGLAGILLILPMFYLGKELFDRRVGFWATAIFQC